MLAHESGRWDDAIKAVGGQNVSGSVGIRSERVEAWGGGRSYDLDTCGRLGRRDECTQGVLRYISRSLVSALAVCHSVSRWR